MFTGFIIYIYNEFEDEESGHFVKPLPAGVSMEECHFNQTSQSVIILPLDYFIFSVIGFLFVLLVCLFVFVLSFWYLFTCLRN